MHKIYSPLLRESLRGFLSLKIKKMKRLYEKYRAKLVRLSEEVVGTIVGYSNSHLILLLEDSVEPGYAFSLDDIGDEEPFVDFTLIGDCETCLLCWVDENNITKKNVSTRTDTTTL
jgi:hypothetical protein